MKHTEEHKLSPNKFGCLIRGSILSLAVVLATIVPASLAFWILSDADAPGYVLWPTSVAAGLWSFLSTVAFSTTTTNSTAIDEP